MLFKLLPHTDKKLLLNLCKLLALSDNTLLWDGKTIDEVTSNTDLNLLSIEKDPQEEELISELVQSAALVNVSASITSMFSKAMPGSDIEGFIRGFSNNIEKRLIEALKQYPIHKVNMPESRIAATNTVLSELLEGFGTDKPEVPKIMLYELILVALKDGSISEVEMAFLKEFQQKCEIEDFIFDDIFERAQALNAEIAKTMSLVYE